MARANFFAPLVLALTLVVVVQQTFPAEAKTTTQTDSSSYHNNVVGNIEPTTIKIANLSCQELSDLGNAISKVLLQERKTGDIRKLALVRAQQLAGEAEDVGGLFSGPIGFFRRFLSSVGWVTVKPPENVITLSMESEAAISAIGEVGGQWLKEFVPGGQLGAAIVTVLSPVAQLVGKEWATKDIMEEISYFSVTEAGIGTLDVIYDKKTEEAFVNIHLEDLKEELKEQYGWENENIYMYVPFEKEPPKLRKTDGNFDYKVVFKSEAMESPLLAVPFFSQRDGRWSSDKLGVQGPSIYSSGCALTSATMAMTYYGVDTDPGRLNRLIDEIGYTEDYLLKWQVVAKQCSTEQKDIEFVALLDGDWQDLKQRLDEELTKGHPVIAWVKSSKVQTHFIVFRGRTENAYHFFDPADGNVTDRTWPKGYHGEYELLGLRIYHGALVPLWVTPVIQSQYTLTPPVIDGTRDSMEWPEPAFTKQLDYANQGFQEKHDMIGYFMNDDNYLYVAIVITSDDFEAERPEKSDVDVIEIYFDNNSNNMIEPNEDIHNFWNLQYGDWHFEENERWCSDQNTHGQGKATHSNRNTGDYIYEFKIPLNSGDVQDLSVTSGSVIGIKILYKEMHFDSETGKWGWEENSVAEDGWPNKESRFDGSTYGKLVLGKPSPVPTEQPNPLMQTHLLFVLNPGFRSIKELDGALIIGEHMDGPSYWITWASIALNASGVSARFGETDSERLLNCLQLGAFDAVLVTTHPWSPLNELIASGKGRFLPWSTEAVEAVTKAFPTELMPSTLPANTYNGQTEPILGYATKPATPTPYYAGSFKIAFHCEFSGNDDIYIINADGSHLKRLTHDLRFDGQPTWSPDGRMIAFQSQRDGNQHIYAMDSDGSNQVRLTGTAGNERSPAWSPDGTRIAFERGGNEIWIMNSDGTNQRKVCSISPSYCVVDLAWSPDGSKIAFTNQYGEDMNQDIYVMNADGSNPINITKHPVPDNSPSWWPDSRRITFCSYRDGSPSIYVMNADGSNLMKVVANGEKPSMSPDGTRILFIHDHGIWEMNTDGSNQKRLFVSGEDLKCSPLLQAEIAPRLLSDTEIRVKTETYGKGEIISIPLELYYLPLVVCSENPNAPYESLKAQAVASRSFALYKKLIEPRSKDYDVLDSEADQVLNPDMGDRLTRERWEEIRRAVEETEGIVLTDSGKIVCAFFVSGTGGTEKYVTYNESKSGDSIVQTPLGLVTNPPSNNPYNRGCMGQVQANELASKGHKWDEILRYFYGSDVTIEKAE